MIALVMSVSHAVSAFGQTCARHVSYWYKLQEMSTGAGPGPGRIFYNRACPARFGPGRIIYYLASNPGRIFHRVRIRAVTLLHNGISTLYEYCQILCTENQKLTVQFELVILNRFSIQFYKLLINFYSFLKFSVEFLELSHNFSAKVFKFSHNLKCF